MACHHIDTTETVTLAECQLAWDQCGIKVKQTAESDHLYANEKMQLLLQYHMVKVLKIFINWAIFEYSDIMRVNADCLLTLACGITLLALGGKTHEM